jgi:hypothetical protein
MATQSKLAGALSRNPKLERVSPGVYRNPKGDLVTAGGRALPRPAQPSAPQPGDYQPMVFPGQQPQEFIQPPPNVPVQPWEMMGGNQAGIRPAMQTPYDRYRFGQQQIGQQLGQQAGQLAEQQNRQPGNQGQQQQPGGFEQMIWRNPPRNYPLNIPQNAGSQGNQGAQLPPWSGAFVMPTSQLPTGPLMPSNGNNGNSNNPGASAPTQQPRFRV